MELIKNKFDIYKDYIRDLWLFSLPIIIGNLGHYFIGVGDVLIAAKHSTNTIAAISIATSIFMSIFIVGIGLMLSISPVLANLRGEKKRTKKLFMVSVNYSLVLSMIFCLLIRSILLFVDKIGFEPHLVPMIKEYIDICSYSVFGAYLYQALKEFLQSYEIVTLPNMISIVAIFVNIFFNIMFVFGIWGFPELGIKGLAISSVIVRSFMGLSLLAYCWRLTKGSLASHRGYIGQLLKVGYPISISILVEFMGFNIVAIVIGCVSGLYAAAHNIVLSLAGTTFMVPLAISNAMAVKVGLANGMKDFVKLKRFAISGVILAVGFMVFTASLFIFFPEFFIKIFTDDKSILSICVPIMFVVGLFQVFDGLQVALGGILKGIKTTKAIMVSMFSGYWLLGFPLGYYLAFNQGMNLMGFWIGLAFSLFSASLILAGAVIVKLKKLQNDFSNY